MGPGRVAVVGATGAVGREIVRILEERAFPLDELALFATTRSEGKRIPFGDDGLTVRALSPSSRPFLGHTLPVPPPQPVPRSFS